MSKDVFSSLLDHDFLSEDVKTSLTEAFNLKLQEKAAAVEADLAEQFGRRFAEAKRELVAATEKLVTETVTEYANQREQENEAIRQERAKLTESVREQRQKYQAKLAEHTAAITTFVQNTLKAELTDLSKDVHELREQRKKYARKLKTCEEVNAKALREHIARIDQFVVSKLREEIEDFTNDRRKTANMLVALQENTANAILAIKEDASAELKVERDLLRESRASLAKARNDAFAEMEKRSSALAEQYNKRLNKIEKFVVEQVSNELTEFANDTKALQEERAVLRESSAKALAKAKQDFITRAATMVEKTVNTRVEREMTGMRSLIEQASKNELGRKMYEAYSSVFSSNYFDTNKEVMKLKASLQESEQKRKELSSLAANQAKLIESVTRKEAIANDVAERAVIINDLLQPLDKTKRSIMEQHLSSVKTENLREAYARYVPLVLNSKQPSQINESVSNTRPIIGVVSGDRNLQESATKTEAGDTHLTQLARLAGVSIKKDI